MARSAGVVKTLVVVVLRNAGPVVSQGFSLLRAEDAEAGLGRLREGDDNPVCDKFNPNGGYTSSAFNLVVQVGGNWDCRSVVRDESIWGPS